MCDRYGISSFVYRARKPFHPKRLFDLIHDKFIILHNTDKEEEEGDEAGSGSGDEAMDRTPDENEGVGENSDTGMEDDLAGKDFEREIDHKVILPPSHLQKTC